MMKQDGMFGMVEKWETTLPGGHGPEARTVYVYTPAWAEKEPEARFPVLYMFDGHNVFFDSDATYGKSWGMKEFMEYSDTPMIVVAVDCDHSPDNGRLKEYAPFSFKDSRWGSIQGRGQQFMDWMITELKPLIDQRYPTLPEREYTFIAGSSMGGLMSLYAVLQHNDVFSRAACLSPSVWTCPRPMRRLIARADVEEDTVIYMDYGSREMANHEGMLPLFADTVARLLRRGLHLTSRIVPGGEHCEASWEEQIPFFINTLLYHKS